MPQKASNGCGLYLLPNQGVRKGFHFRSKRNLPFCRDQYNGLMPSRSRTKLFSDYLSQIARVKHAVKFLIVVLIPKQKNPPALPRVRVPIILYNPAELFPNIFCVINLTVIDSDKSTAGGCHRLVFQLERDR